VNAVGAAQRKSVPLLLTWSRWFASSVAVGASLVAMTAAVLGFLHSQRSLASLAGPLLAACALEALVVYALLRAEEWRLASELRTARTGTPVLRAMIVRRRERAPLVARLFTTKVGLAAVLLADGDRAGAVDALSARAPLAFLVQRGRLDRLRAVLDADLDRASGTPDGLDRCVEHLGSSGEAGAPIGNKEADLYRTHVLVKAILERGDTERAFDLAQELGNSPDDDERLYSAWLRAWFHLEAEGPEVAWPDVDEGQLRMAALVARAHGAERLVAELEARLSAIARPSPQG
jgi:hypothetical protein